MTEIINKLRTLLERERAMAALAEAEDPRGWMVRYALESLADALPRGTALRLDLRYLPGWWVARQDRTQIDGRVLVSHVEREVGLQIPGGPSFRIGGHQLIDGILQGTIQPAD